MSNNEIIQSNSDQGFVPIGNMHIEELEPQGDADFFEESDDGEYQAEGSEDVVAQWKKQGIEYRITEPVATKEYTVEQLGKMGQVGVEIKKPQKTVTQ